MVDGNAKWLKGSQVSAGNDGEWYCPGGCNNYTAAQTSYSGNGIAATFSIY
jgi:hypothetical protein